MDVNDSMVLMRCCVCGIPFMMTRSLYDLKMGAMADSDRSQFFCPSGHSQRLTISLADQLSAKVTELEKKLAAETKRADKNYDLWAEAQSKVHPKTIAMVREVSGG